MHRLENRFIAEDTLCAGGSLRLGPVGSRLYAYSITCNGATFPIPEREHRLSTQVEYKQRSLRSESRSFANTYANWTTEIEYLAASQDDSPRANLVETSSGCPQELLHSVLHSGRRTNLVYRAIAFRVLHGKRFWLWQQRDWASRRAYQ